MFDLEMHAFLQWKCGYADGFDFVSSIKTEKLIIACPDAYTFTSKRGFDGNKWDDIYNPLLIQNAIEGINEKNEIYEIFQAHNHIVVNGFKTFFFEDFDSVLECKDAVLKYVFHKEIGIPN